METKYVLINNEQEHQYEFNINGYIARIEYIISNNGEIFLTYTEVPKMLEGKGVGSMLIEESLKDVKRRGLKLVPLCPFVVAYIKKNPQWKQLIIKGVNV